jgi:hypothetical protein
MSLCFTSRALPLGLSLLLGCGGDLVVVGATYDAGTDAAADAPGDAQVDVALVADPCIDDVGPTIPSGSCDGSGICGGVSVAEGCINCALKGECGQYYFAANADQQSWVAWNVCGQNCRVGSPPGWSCCDRDCDAEFPAVAAAMNAWEACTFCRLCVQDCGGQPEQQDLRCH